MARTKVVVDPITRIEGHLRIEVAAEDGRIADAWASSTQFRGIELVMQGRDPRDAWAFTQRICGVCTVVHAIASCRAVEDALDIRVPANANTIRNLVHGMQTVQDHVIHFYHLHALDWVDVVSALSADPAETSRIAALHDDLDAAELRGRGPCVRNAAGLGLHLDAQVPLDARDRVNYDPGSLGHAVLRQAGC